MKTEDFLKTPEQRRRWRQRIADDKKRRAAARSATWESLLAGGRKKTIAVYARVSTTGQDVAPQVPDLRTWLSHHGRGRSAVWYRDTFTGKTMRRPAMQKLEADIRAGRVGTLVVWRLDRLGRTASEMLRFLDELDATGVSFVSIRDGVDASSASGRLLRTILAGFAEYEREVISERVKAGIARARSSGKRWGGKKPGQRHRLTQEKLSALKDLLVAGKKKTAIARQLGVSRASVYRAAKILEAMPAGRSVMKRGVL